MNEIQEFTSVSAMPAATETSEERKRKTTASWRERNKEYVRQYKREYNLRNRAKIRATERSYRVKNKDKMRAIKARYSAKNRKILALKQSERYKGDRDRFVKEFAEHRKKRLDWLAAYCRQAGCKSCGEHDERVLDFHHRDASERYKRVSEMWGSSIKKIEAEIAKCDVLCANCHHVVEFKISEASNKPVVTVGKHKHLLRKLKSMRGCVSCRMNNVDCLHFHHWDRAGKTCNVMSLVNRPLSSIAKELAKCEVKCANCHRRDHARKGRRR